MDFGVSHSRFSELRQLAPCHPARGLANFLEGGKRLSGVVAGRKGSIDGCFLRLGPIGRIGCRWNRRCKGDRGIWPEGLSFSHGVSQGCTHVVLLPQLNDLLIDFLGNLPQLIG